MKNAIVVVSGPKGAGKSTLAEALQTRIREDQTLDAVAAVCGFAEPIKSALVEMGFDEKYLRGHEKETEIPGFGVTGRYLMQTLGTEWGRETIRPDFWAMVWGIRVKRALNSMGRFQDEFDHIFADAAQNDAPLPRITGVVIADDLRFPNELETARNIAAGSGANFLHIAVTRPNWRPTFDSHASEKEHEYLQSIADLIFNNYDYSGDNAPSKNAAKWSLSMALDWICERLRS